MGRRGNPPSARVAEAQESGKTARTYARWDAGKRILPSLLASASAFGVAVVQEPASGLNFVLATVLAIVVPSALVKIFWDARQKRRLRARLDALEQDNRKLTTEVSDLRQQLPRRSSSP